VIACYHHHLIQDLQHEDAKRNRATVTIGYFFQKGITVARLSSQQLIQYSQHKDANTIHGPSIYVAGLGNTIWLLLPRMPTLRLVSRASPGLLYCLSRIGGIWFAMQLLCAHETVSRVT